MSGCNPGDEVALTWEVGNQGAVASEPATLELYLRAGATETLLTTEPIPSLDAGTTRGGSYSGTSSVFAGATGVAFRLADVTHAECDGSNQEAQLDTPFCP